MSLQKQKREKYDQILKKYYRRRIGNWNGTGTGDWNAH